MFYEQKVSHPFDYGSPELALVADTTSRIMIGFIIKTMAPSNMLPTFLLFQQPQTPSLRIDSANNADSYASWLFSLDHYNTANVRNVVSWEI